MTRKTLRYVTLNTGDHTSQPASVVQPNSIRLVRPRVSRLLNRQAGRSAGSRSPSRLSTASTAASGN